MAYGDIKWQNGNPMMEDQNGSYIYVSPAMSLEFLNVPGMREWATSHGVDFGPNDSSIAINRPSGGVLHDSGTWNAQTGQYDQGLDWGNLLTMVVGGLMTAGAADAMLSSGAVAGVPEGVTSVSQAPELVGTTADVSGGLGTAGAADAGTFGAGAGAGTGAAAAAPTAGGASEFAAVGGVEGLPEGLPAAAPTFLSPLASGVAPVGAPAAGGFTPAAAAPLASTPITLPPTGVASTAGADYSASGIPSGGGPSYQQIANLLKAAGQGVGGATSAAGNNQLARGNAQVAAARGIEDAYLSDAELEQQQRANELKDTYRQGVVSSGARSPYDPVAPVYGQDYQTSVSNLSRQGAQDLAQAPIYGIRNIPKPTDIYPDPKTAFAETGMQKVGDWLGPALTIAGSVPPSVYSQIFNWL